jgi:hypothetical protein
VKYKDIKTICIISFIFLISCPSLAQQSLQINDRDTVYQSSFLSVHTIPSGANVYLDSILIGTSPLDSVLISSGNHFVKLTAQSFIDRSIIISVKPLERRKIEFTLIPKFGFISVRTIPRKGLIIIDQDTCSESAIDTATISLGKHLLTVINPDFTTVMKEEFTVYRANFRKYEANFPRHSYTAMYYSMLVPGLGQIKDGSYLKGCCELFATVGAGCFVWQSYKNKKNKEDLFTQSLVLYQTAHTEPDAISARRLVENASKDLSNAKKQFNISRILLGSVYLLNLLDATIFHSVQKTIDIQDDVQLSLPEIQDVLIHKNIQVGIIVKY